MLAVAVVALSAAVLVLFAMMGELTSRMERISQGSGFDEQLSPTGTPILAARVGHRPEWYPTDMEIDSGVHTVLVVSTVCTSCSALVAELVEQQRFDDLLVLVVCRTEETGWDFVERHDLRRHASGVYLDLTGFWLLEEFNIASSPAVVRFEDAVLTEASNVTSTSQLLAFARGAVE